MDWKKAFNDMGERINEIADDATNRGGCCVVAGLIGKALEAKGVRVIGGAVHAGGYMATCNNVEEARAKVQAKKYPNLPTYWHKAGFDFPHVLIVFAVSDEVYIYDTDEGVIPFHLYRPRLREGFLTVEEMNELTSTHEGWNPRFNRAHIPAIAREVKRTINKMVLP